MQGMAEPRRGRAHDAEGAREAIICAAEEAFAQHGFDGARIDAIAAASGYNKSLIFHYFEDKLGLYSAVIRRLKEQGEAVVEQAIMPFLSDGGPVIPDARTFRAFLETSVRMSFDFLLAHPHMLRILAWEAAEGWQTYTLAVTRYDMGVTVNIKQLFHRAQLARFLRPGLSPLVLHAIAFGICQCYLTSIPRYQRLFKDEDLTSTDALMRAREQIVDFVVHGIMADPGETKR